MLVFIYVEDSPYIFLFILSHVYCFDKGGTNICKQKEVLNLFAISSLSIISMPFSMNIFGSLCFLFVLIKIPSIIFQVTLMSSFIFVNMIS